MSGTARTTWIVQSLIEKIEPGDITSVVAEFLLEFERRYKAMVLVASAGEGKGEFKGGALPDSDSKKLARRGKETRAILVGHFKGDVYYKYQTGGIVAALLAVRLPPAKGGNYRIGDLVAQLGTRGAATEMIQFAVNQSMAYGHHGRVRLVAKNPDARDIYVHLEFRPISDRLVDRSSLELDPAKSKKWKLVGGEWRYARTGVPADASA